MHKRVPQTFCELPIFAGRKLRAKMMLIVLILHPGTQPKLCLVSLLVNEGIQLRILDIFMQFAMEPSLLIPNYNGWRIDLALCEQSGVFVEPTADNLWFIFITMAPYVIEVSSQHKTLCFQSIYEDDLN